MINLGTLVNEGKARLKFNPVNQSYSVIVLKDQFDSLGQYSNYSFELDNKVYNLTENKFDSNIVNVNLNNNKITEEQVLTGYLKFD